MRKIIYILLVCSTFVMSIEEEGYGWNIPNSSLNLGGYLDFTYDDIREEKLLLNDIALLFSGTQNRFDVLAEVELSHIPLDGKRNNSTDIDLNVERLQLSYTFNEKQMLRVGRFNSDIGYWNQAPIPILQDTTTKPHMVGKLFPRFTTGALFQQKIDSDNQITLSYQNNNDITHQETSVDITQHSAFAYLGTKDDFSWRFSLGAYTDTAKEKFHYAGIGANYDIDEVTLQSELFFEESQKTDKKPYSGYVQFTWHLKDKQDAVVRYERYDDKILNIEENIYLIGYVYRPKSNISLKGEYIYHSKLPLNRFVYSLSVLF